MSGIYTSAFPEMRHGETREHIEDGHVFRITATRRGGIHTGRRRYVVECLTCRETIHEATTGPMQNVGYHLREIARNERGG